MAGSRFSQLVLSVSAVAALGACSSIDFTGDRIDGSGDVETRTFDVGEFAQVDVGWAFEAEVTVTPGEATTVAVTADDNFFEHITVDVSSNTLEARTKSDVNLDGDDRILITVTTPTLAGVHISGAAVVTIRAEGTDVTDFDASGASRLRVLDLDGSDIAIDVSGASRVTIEGARADTASVDVSGASSINLRQLALDSARVSVAGASNAEFGRADVVSGSASGASEIGVDADTTIDIDTSGSSSVQRR